MLGTLHISSDFDTNFAMATFRVDCGRHVHTRRWGYGEGGRLATSATTVVMLSSSHTPWNPLTI